MRYSSTHSRLSHILPPLAWSLFILIILFLLLYRLNDFPTLWWDEGWTLSAVRNWIEHGHLGNYLNGQPVPPGIPLRFPVAVAVAISMRIFGIGIWQGRLPGVVFTLLTLILYAYLISKIYNRRTGIAAVIMVLCLSPFTFQPLYMGRQVMAEMPMMFFLLGGYTMLWLALSHKPAWGVMASILFGIGIHAKLQVPPFWLVSIILALGVAIRQRAWRSLKIIAGVAVGSAAVSALVLLAQNSIMPGSFDDPALINILWNTSVMVFEWSIRWKALYITILFALPQLLGLIWGGIPVIKNFLTPKNSSPMNINPQEVNRNILHAAIWGLGASWLIWYMTMSMYWIRYIFPAYFIGYLFTSGFLSEYTDGFDFRKTVHQASTLFIRGKFNRNSIKAVVLILAAGVALGLAVGSMRIGFARSNWEPLVASNYIRDNIPHGSRVETYESELFFLNPELNYHYPPDIVSMKLYRRADIDKNYSINYDPMLANPDYIVVGPYAQVYGVYDDVLSQGWFTIETEIGGYQIYRAKRTQ